jgi:hypothetical protein
MCGYLVGGMTIGDNWGATGNERETRQPCDELISKPGFICNRAISVHAPPAVTFRWLCQLREAPYSYDPLDNLGRRSPRQLTPGADRLEVGQRFMKIFTLTSFDRDRQITLRSGGTAVTYGVLPEGTGTRLLVRVLFDPGTRIGAALAPLLVVGDLVMMRKQLINLRDLAERGAGDTPAPDRARCPPET